MPFRQLIKGFQDFHTKYFLEAKDLYESLNKHGQSPDVLVIACSDSRNDPALLLQSEPGDMFVVRNVAAIVPPYQPDHHYHGTSAAIEFAVKKLKVKDIVVLGHALCGGVAALLDGRDETDPLEFLSDWIEIGSEARGAVLRHLSDTDKTVQCRALEQAIILTSLNNLMSFPWVREAVTTGHITLHGWYFDMSNGKMLGLNFATGTFDDITDSRLGQAFARKTTHYCDCCMDKLVQQCQG